MRKEAAALVKRFEDSFFEMIYKMISFPSFVF